MHAIVAQCGGPTPVVNATLAAVIAAWQEQGAGRLYGSRHGFEGLVRGDWAELSALNLAALEQLAQQPGAALGGSRYRPRDEEFEGMAANLRDADIDAVFLIGGNGTMAGARRLAAVTLPGRGGASWKPPLFQEALQVIGIPKTIDNDLPGCAVTPGFGSAARYVAHTTQEIGLDLRAMRGFDQVAVVEVMGRHVGWLAAAAALARHEPRDPPHLILLPETPVATEEVLARIAAVHAQRGICTVVVAEGVREQAQPGQEEGAYWAELVDGAAFDASGQRVFSMSAGASAYLVKQVQELLGLRCRQIKLNTAQRATRLLASSTDRSLAAQVGRAAVDAWRQGLRGVLPVLVQRDGAWQTEIVPLQAVMGRERVLPPEYIAAPDYDVTDACRAYIAAVSGEHPPRPLLWMD